MQRQRISSHNLIGNILLMKSQLNYGRDRTVINNLNNIEQLVSELYGRGRLKLKKKPKNKLNANKFFNSDSQNNVIISSFNFRKYLISNLL